MSAAKSWASTSPVLDQKLTPWLANRFKLAPISAFCFSVKRLHATLASILTRASRSSSAAFLNSAASFSSLPARSSACAARSPVAAKSLFKYTSLTFPIHTSSTVETAPTINAAIKNQFAMSYSLDAQSSDGHIRMPPWFPLLAIGIIVFSGTSALVSYLFCP